MQRCACIIFLYFIALVALVSADTEIRNFRLPLPDPPLAQTESVPTQVETILSSSQRQIVLNVSTYDSGRWINLILDEDYRAWTIRMSWPASQPTKFQLDLVPNPDPNLMQAFLRIAAKPLSPTMPHPLLDDWYPARAKPDARSFEKLETTFQLVLEPLVFGFLPRTAVPTVLMIVVSLLGSSMAVPSIIRVIESLRLGDVGAKDERTKVE
ncbi:hypothetical protein BCR39DRAFT_585592 [Naematelia encephala]|uniref:GPI transamidase component PIG-T n=1 Tax=Naematelia encephala TaxID=71784 RepID=A0A1Y2BIL7_9TREE|nr:hypothetical protein BCR39DRAFT_585592 [Naematelia encephala]